MSIDVSKIAQFIGAKIHGSVTEVYDLKSLEQATQNDIAFVNGDKYLSQALASQAGVLIAPANLVDTLKQQFTVLEVASPYVAFAMLTHWFEKTVAFNGVSPTAQIDKSAKIGQNVTIGDYVVIGKNVTIDDDCVIYPHTFIDADVMIGQSAMIHANVSIMQGTQLGKRVRIHANTCIGSEGFGFAPYQGQWYRIAQLGKVVIGNDVRIGSNVSIDRGALDDTVIDDGVILDNLIQVAHNVHIGKNTAIAASTVIAGSTHIGANCVIGGACAIAGHLTIADQVNLTGMAMITKSISQSGTYSSGTSQLENQAWRKAVVGFRQLSQTPIQQIVKQLNQLKQRIDMLEHNK
ncbi:MULTISPECIES: UDP-3-O-(3-hydroxymyristoyl)glucosamine N-acyltransferase [unclassified Acinetobacter]|uniref:UDP-3-O-(3-hydroxymyristoyl)glucosamine N-acyltransferase n=1 Tax=unclassified Acinetobacter TaxID=196816 RepID=UPI0035BA7EF4